jgi:membrane protease YdiL (CAAX protease family)
VLIFVVVFNLIALSYNSDKAKGKRAKPAASIIQKEKYDEELALRRANMEKLLAEDRRLATIFGLVTLLALATLLLGSIVDLIMLKAILKNNLNIRTISPPEAAWTVLDVCKVVVLFLFFGYMIVISEASLSRIFPLLKSENVRMIMNTSVLDVIVVLLVIYFAILRYKADIISLGLSLKNFFKNIFYGIIAYIALLPVLVVILAATAFVIHMIKYVPAKQPVVELLLKEKDVAFLAYSSLFAAILGPLVEELFFRGFLYNALKKYIGVFWSMAATAAIFATLHAHAVGFLPIMALGALLAYLYEKTGTLVSSITVHMIHNLSMVLMVFLVKQAGVV